MRDLKECYFTRIRRDFKYHKIVDYFIKRRVKITRVDSYLQTFTKKLLFTNFHEEIIVYKLSQEIIVYNLIIYITELYRITQGHERRYA